MLIKLRRIILQLSIPIQKLIQKIHPRECDVPYSYVRQVVASLRNGDILVSNESWHLSNLTIPGRMNHAAIFFGGYVYEAVAQGVVRVDPVDWFMRKNEFAVCRPVWEGRIWHKKMHQFLLKAVGKPYDLMFGDTKTDQSFYCSELSWLAWEAMLPYVKWTLDFTRREVMGQKTILAQDFYDAAKKGKTKIVAEYLQD